MGTTNCKEIKRVNEKHNHYRRPKRAQRSALHKPKMQQYLLYEKGRI